MQRSGRTHSAQPSTIDEAHERRKQPRVTFEVEVNLGSENNFYAGVTGDISTGGVFVATYTAPPVRAVVEMSLALGDEVFQLRGTVLWHRNVEHASDHAPAGCGIQWIDLSPAAEQAISRFVMRRDTILYDDD